MSDFMFEWSPAEWKEFSNGYNETVDRILADEKLYKKFNEIVEEQIAVAEESGGTRRTVETIENFQEIVLRNNFV